MSDQPTASDLRQELRAFIAETFLELRPDVELADDDRFLALGVIDSLGLLELVEEIRGRYGIDVEDVDITEENFGSIAALASYIEGKRL
jgi:D-alanine--poly(phosphoribitol) ligase subunit 2